MQYSLYFLGEQNAIQLTKTPDTLLTTDIIVDGFVIKWVESKALFGSSEALEEHFKTQLLPYNSRYGPGLVIYWFGFVVERAAKLGGNTGGRGLILIVIL